MNQLNKAARALATLPLFLAACSSTGTAPDAPQKPLIVAHRGASHDAPENTLSAFHLAWEQGADAIEGDFRLSADGEVICLHDADTERTAGVKLVAAQSTLAELRELEYGAWKGAEFDGEPLPTLREVLAIVPEGKRLFLEVKGDVKTMQVIAEELRATELPHEQICVIAFDAEVIAESKRSFPGLEAMWLTGHEQDEESGAWSNPLEEVLPRLAEIGADGLDTSFHAELIDEAFVEALRADGYQFHVWTIDDAERALRLRKLGVDSITTNRPAELRAELSASEVSQ
jgi:glycerophosphoryl diester phosphodiesterase